MPQFYASCALGLVDELEREIVELGFSKVTKSKHGIYFDTNWEGCYRANLWSRLASRIVKPILDFPAYNSDELYDNIRKHDFTKYIPEDGTLDIVCSVREGMLRDQRFVAMRVKDAIVDQFREKTGIRPSISDENPDLKIIVQAYKNQFSVALDTSGDSLHRRGYRERTGVAPIKENLAAGLLKLSRWKPGIPLVDPMCGSGTFLIEAALMANNMAPGLSRKSFGFERLNNFSKEAWKTLVDEAMDSEKPYEMDLLFGSDQDGKIIRVAKENARRAGVDEYIQFRRQDIATLTSPCATPGVMIVNPPYGDRLGELDLVKDAYRDLGYTLKKEFASWDVYILSGHPELTQELRLKADKKFQLMNGPINCRFLHYPISTKQY